MRTFHSTTTDCDLLDYSEPELASLSTDYEERCESSLVVSVAVQSPSAVVVTSSSTTVAGMTPSPAVRDLQVVERRKVGVAARFVSTPGSVVSTPCKVADTVESLSDHRDSRTPATQHQESSSSASSSSSSSTADDVTRGM